MGEIDFTNTVFYMNTQNSIYHLSSIEKFMI